MRVGSKPDLNGKNKEIKNLFNYIKNILLKENTFVLNKHMKRGIMKI